VVYDSLLGIDPTFLALCREFLLFPMKAPASGGKVGGPRGFLDPRPDVLAVHARIRSELG
jgi:hypothetical protein